ncbi:MAG: PhzF family phenazine biosynthesis protein [Candidatus Freyarchaeum deiterrae]
MTRKIDRIRIYQVDSFTNRAYSGNPAAVCILSELKDESWLQVVARELNPLSETAFLHKKKDGYDLRWFTPKEEVDLCGHATLASAHILWETNQLREDEEARFHTLSGLLTAKKQDEWIELNFPAEVEKEADPPKELLESLGIEAKYVGKNRFDYLIEVESEETVRNITPNFELLKKVNTRGVMVTSTSASKEYDFVSRFFAPRIGINEDPVTGSAHCCLGPYWKKKLKRDEFLAYQASERGGIIKVRVGKERVYLGGQAVTVLIGELVA